MGRPSLAAERRQQIIEAFAESIQAVGYEATTLEEIAKRAGVKRTLIRHYFGNRDDLISSALEHLTDEYRKDYLSLVESLPTRKRLIAVLDHFFGGEFNQRPSEDAVVDALVAASYRNEPARAALRCMYDTFEKVCYDEIKLAFPKAQKKRVRSAAYAFMCLAEQNATLLGLGVDFQRCEDARAGAEAILSDLRRYQKERRRG